MWELGIESSFSAKKWTIFSLKSFQWDYKANVSFSSRREIGIYFIIGNLIKILSLVIAYLYKKIDTEK